MYKMRVGFLLFCRIILLTSVLSGTVLKGENIPTLDKKSSLPPNGSSARLDNVKRQPFCNPMVESNRVTNNAPAGKAETELLNRFRKYTRVRTQLIQRAEQYLKSVEPTQGKILPTAFVVEGLLDFGLPATDIYIRTKALRLRGYLSPEDGRVHDDDGFHLHAETAYIYRILNLLHSPSLRQKDFMGDELISDVQNTLLVELPENAVEFLSQTNFVMPSLGERRARILGLNELSNEDAQFLAVWSIIPAINGSEYPPPAVPISPEYVFISGIGNIATPKIDHSSYQGTFYSLAGTSAPLTYASLTRVSGFILVVRSIVLQI